MLSVNTIKLTIRLGWSVALIVLFWQACTFNPHGSVSFLNDKVLHVTAFLVLGIWAQIGWTQHKHRIMSLGFLVLLWYRYRMCAILCPRTILFAHRLGGGYSGVGYCHVAGSAHE